eukprot:TRINITY_DN5205_c0_g1_i4.p1 TRINITY_DN5205_c0_g1~~TRINITY_DN5205_c0_g1_i4.p1  ORF type:complete len:363 (+),score=90.21 TRINITY_DN5205_c0_g1_i4:95-1090(+)
MRRDACRRRTLTPSPPMQPPHTPHTLRIMARTMGGRLLMVGLGVACAGALRVRPTKPPRATPAPADDGPVQNFDLITCPVMGMFVRSGRIVPDAQGFVTKDATLAAFRAAMVPDDIAVATTDANFRSDECPRCAGRINVFAMNVVADRVEDAESPSFGPQEHFRSTGVRDNDANRPDEKYFNLGEAECLGGRGAWTRRAALCFADFWDVDFGCPRQARRAMFSNDVDELKRPKGCERCDSRTTNGACESQLHEAILGMWETFKDPVTNAVSAMDWRRMWLELEMPSYFPYIRIMPVCTRPLDFGMRCAASPDCCARGLACVKGRCEAAQRR